MRPNRLDEVLRLQSHAFRFYNQAFNVALQEPTLTSDVINYGNLETDPRSVKQINASILGIFGGQYRGISVEDVREFEQVMKQMDKKVEIMIYPNAGHGFENPNNDNGYRAADAADAWKLTVKFLAETIGK